MQKAVPVLFFLGRWEEVVDDAARLLAVRRTEPIWTAVQLNLRVDLRRGGARLPR